MDFEVEGPWNIETMAEKKKIMNSIRSSMAKKGTFDPGGSF